MTRTKEKLSLCDHLIRVADDIIALGKEIPPMAEQPTSKPLPCPFCGSTDIAIEKGSTFRWMVAVCSCGAQAGEARVQTLGDGTPAEWEARGRRAALAEWNTRHTDETAACPTCRAPLSDGAGHTVDCAADKSTDAL
jgi:hypothetical protein